MIPPERAQAGLERERNAYWIRKAADKVRRQDQEAKAARFVPNRADMRANREGGMIWSKVARPVRPSDALIRAERLREARRKARAEATR